MSSSITGEINPRDILKSIPGPVVVRTELGRSLRRTILLRRLLRLSDAARKERHAGVAVASLGNTEDTSPAGNALDDMEMETSRLSQNKGHKSRDPRGRKTTYGESAGQKLHYFMQLNLTTWSCREDISWWEVRGLGAKHAKSAEPTMPTATKPGTQRIRGPWERLRDVVLARLPRSGLA